jgi:hypothetical protein
VDATIQCTSSQHNNNNNNNKKNPEDDTGFGSQLFDLQYI